MELTMPSSKRCLNEIDLGFKTEIRECDLLFAI